MPLPKRLYLMNLCAFVKTFVSYETVCMSLSKSLLSYEAVCLCQNVLSYEAVYLCQNVCIL